MNKIASRPDGVIAANHQDQDETNNRLAGIQKIGGSNCQTLRYNLTIISVKPWSAEIPTTPTTDISVEELKRYLI